MKKYKKSPKTLKISDLKARILHLQARLSAPHPATYARVWKRDLAEAVRELEARQCRVKRKRTARGRALAQKHAHYLRRRCRIYNSGGLRYHGQRVKDLPALLARIAKAKEYEITPLKNPLRVSIAQQRVRKLSQRIAKIGILSPEAIPLVVEYTFLRKRLFKTRSAQLFAEAK